MRRLDENLPVLQFRIKNGTVVLQVLAAPASNFAHKRITFHNEEFTEKFIYVFRMETFTNDVRFN